MAHRCGHPTTRRQCGATTMHEDTELSAAKGIKIQELDQETKDIIKPVEKIATAMVTVPV